MEVLTFSLYAHLLAAVLLFLAGAFLLMHTPQKIIASHILGASFITIGLSRLMLVLLYSSKNTEQLLYYYSFGNVCRILFLPLSYLAVNAVLYKRGLTKFDVLHAIPFILFISGYFPFSNEASYHEFVAMKAWTGNDLYLRPHSRWLPSNAYIPFFTVTFLLYWFLSARLILKAIRNKSPGLNENIIGLRWLFCYNGIQFFILFSYFLLLLRNSEWHLWIASQVFGSGGCIFLSLSVWWWQEKLYKISGPEHEPLYTGNSKLKAGSLTGVKNESEPAVSDDKHEETEPVREDRPIEALQRGSILSDARTMEISARLIDFMENNTPYLRHSYSIQDLSNDVNIPSYQLSVFLNKKSGINFHDYMNIYKVRFCMRELQKGKWKNLTLEALAYECGFNNRNTFTTAFKKFSGVNPSDFIRSLNQGS